MKDSPSLLARLGVLGMEAVEPVVIGALISTEPLLLIGPHGTGKSQRPDNRPRPSDRAATAVLAARKGR